MLRSCVYGFARDEQGGGTIFGLFWFALLVGICGLAVDSTNGLRNQTMLQATADAAVLAGAIDLPDASLAAISAVDSSTANMPVDLYGNVLKASDVQVGAWHADTRTFEAGGLSPNPLNPTGPMIPDSVRVTLHQTDANFNAVPVNFLRIIGLDSWDVNVEAVAQRFIPDCLNDGLVASGLVDISSNNNFVNNICIHGQVGVAMQNHNFHELGVNVSMPDLDLLNIPTGGLESNTGLPDALRELSLHPRMVSQIDQIIADILALEPYVIPSYIDTSGGDSGGGGGCVGFGCGGGGTPFAIDVRDDKWDFEDAASGHIYHIQCASNKSVGIPSGKVLVEMVIVSDCQVNVGSGVVLEDVLLASRAGGNPGGGNGGGGNGGGGGVSGGGGPGISNANISFAANVTLGTTDSCAPGGGVQIFTDASVHFSSSMLINGLQVVAAGDVDLGAQDMGINGINVQAGGNITLTSNNAFGLCSGGAPNLQTVAYYRLVH